MENMKHGPLNYDNLSKDELKSEAIRLIEKLMDDAFNKKLLAEYDRLRRIRALIERM